MRWTLVACAVAGLAACSESVAPAPPSIVGTYPLRTINGHPPPQIIVDDEEGTESILGGIVILRDDQSFVDSTDVQVVTPSGVARRQDVARGSWRSTADSVFFRVAGGEYAMALNGAELVQDFFGVELVYRR